MDESQKTWKYIKYITEALAKKKKKNAILILEKS